VAGKPLALDGIPGLARAHQQQPSAHLVELELLHQPRRTSEPPRGSGHVSEIRPVVDAEHQRTLRSLGRVRAATKLGVRALPMGGGIVDLPKPPERLSEPQKSLGGLAQVERRPKGVPGRLPVPGR
jgi:hypothetical protein